MPETQEPIAPGGTTCHAMADATAAQNEQARLPAKLKLQKAFQPCPVEPNEEFYAVGIFEFNITRLTALVDAYPDQFPIESVAVGEIPDYGGANLNDGTVRSADLSRPVLLAEIAPGIYSLIDGHHRVARARRDSVPTVPAYRIPCPAHVSFLTSAVAYDRYVEYWNSKPKDAERRKAPRSRRPT